MASMQEVLPKISHFIYYLYIYIYICICTHILHMMLVVWPGRGHAGWLHEAGRSGQADHQRPLLLLLLLLLPLLLLLVVLEIEIAGRSGLAGREGKKKDPYGPPYF